MRALLALVLAAALAGCADAPAPPSPAPEPVWVGPPEGGGFAPCASSQARELAVPGLRAEATRDDRGLGPGIHRLDNRTFLWVYASYRDTQRQDAITRVNRVEVDVEPDGLTQVCTSVDVSAPLFTDGARRTYALGVLVTAERGFPEGPVRVVVNWVAGCGPCDPTPRGNSTALFPPFEPRT